MSITNCDKCDRQVDTDTDMTTPTKDGEVCEQCDTGQPDSVLQVLNLNAAVSTVMLNIKRLAKSDINKFAGYNFTSVNDFKDMIRPLMATEGLSMSVSEKLFNTVPVVDKKGKDSFICQFTFAIQLHHESGGSATPEYTTVMLPYVGAQTTGQAKSYAVKEWVKSRFLASSVDSEGEADALDYDSSEMRLTKSTGRAVYKRLSDEMEKVIVSRDHKELSAWWTFNLEEIKTLPRDWHIMLNTRCGQAGKELKASEALDNMSEAELDELADKQ